MQSSIVSTPRSRYFQQKQPQIEALFQGAIDDMINRQADDPEAFLLEWLQQRRASPSAHASPSVEMAARHARAEATVVDGASDKWSVAKWLEKHVVAPVADALLRPLGESAPANVALAFVRKIGRDQAAVRSLFDGSLLDDLADVVCAAVASELTGVETSAEALSKKFSETTFTLCFGGLDTYSAGLEGRIGPPNPNLRATMAREHCESFDSNLFFLTSNYGLKTTAEIEWWYVTDPHRGLEELQLTAWPSESLAEIDASHARGRNAPQGRPLADFHPELHRVNGELAGLGEPVLLEEELIGGRLYTGPMFQKYNLVLRSSGEGAPQSLRADFEALCHGNRYATTLHVLNSCIVKLSKLTKVCKVYRGLAKGVLPDAFWNKDKYGVRGGVEAAFMSTTADRSVASSYASGGGAGLLLELEQGMVDRGAELSWLSQYPHEAEVLFAPLTGIELKDHRVEGSVIVAEMSVAVNLMAPTIEKVVSKMQRSHMQLLDLLRDKLLHAGAPAAVLKPIHELHRLAAESAPTVFNNPTHFKNCTLRALECTKEAVGELALRSTWLDGLPAAATTPTGDGAGDVGGGGANGGAGGANGGADGAGDTGALVRRMRTTAVELEEMGEFTICSRVLEMALELSPLDAATLPPIADGASVEADALRERVQDLTRLAVMRWRYRVSNPALLETEAARAKASGGRASPPEPKQLMLLETEALLRDAFRLLDRLPAQGAHPRSAGYRGRAALGLANAISMFGHASRLDEVAALLDEARRFAHIADDLALEGNVLNAFGMLAEKRGGGGAEGMHEAERCYHESLALRERLPEGGAQGALRYQELAQSHVSLGNVYLKLYTAPAAAQEEAGAAIDPEGFHAKAVHHFKRSGKLYSLGFHEGHIKCVNASMGLLNLHEKAGQLEEAMDYLDAIIDTMQQLEKGDHAHHDLEGLRERRTSLQARLDAAYSADPSRRGPPAIRRRSSSPGGRKSRIWSTQVAQLD